jgi:hypothetical protein
MSRSLMLIYNRMGRVKEGSVFDELGQILVNILRHRTWDQASGGRESKRSCILFLF